jgi:hypothetical protein
MTWSRLNDAPRPVLAFLSTWIGHPKADAAYAILQRQEPAPERQETPPPAPLIKRRTKTNMWQKKGTLQKQK